MITETIIQDFESLWRRRGIFHVDLSYGQAFAQYTKCSHDDPMSSFLCNSPYQEVRSWVQDEINANKTIQAKAAGDTCVPTPHKGADKAS